MHSANAGAAISLHDTLSAASTAPEAAAAPANSTRGPIVLLKGGASVRFPAAASGFGSTSDVRTGPVAAMFRMVESVISRIAMNRTLRRNARMRRIGEGELEYLGTHILRDIGMPHGRIDARLRDASHHGPKL